MREIEHESRSAAAKDPSAHHSQNKGRTAVVAEGQHSFRLRFGALAILIQADGCSGPHRVAAHKPQG